MEGYRTIVSVIVSAILKLLVLKGLLAPDANESASVITDAVLLIGSGVADVLAIFFRMKAKKPGALASAGS